MDKNKNVIGVVKEIGERGVLVTLPNQKEGLARLSLDHIKKGFRLLQVGQEVKVDVIDEEKKPCKIFLHKPEIPKSSYKGKEHKHTGGRGRKDRKPRTPEQHFEDMMQKYLQDSKESFIQTQKRNDAKRNIKKKKRKTQNEQEDC